MQVFLKWPWPNDFIEINVLVGSPIFKSRDASLVAKSSEFIQIDAIISSFISIHHNITSLTYTSTPQHTH